jgi:hypothetical protein
MEDAMVDVRSLHVGNRAHFGMIFYLSETIFSRRHPEPGWKKPDEIIEIYPVCNWHADSNPILQLTHFWGYPMKNVF